MKTLSVIATLLLCFLLCGFQQEPSSTQQKPGSKVASANQQKADSGKEPHGAAPSGQPATDATDKNAVAPTAPRQSDRVEVTALPPEIAVKQVKDSIDRTIMWCTIILTGVGIGGTVVAVWTLLAIKDQAKTLHEHSEELRKLAGAARDNAAAARASAEFSQRAVRNSERADILVDAVSIVPSPSGAIDGDARLAVCFKNFGRTRASNVRFDVRMTIPDTTLTSAGIQLPIMVVGPGKGQTVSFQTFRECLTKQTFEDIIQGRTALRFVASVVYEDIFGDSYTTMDIGVFDHRTRAFRLEQNMAG